MAEATIPPKGIGSLKIQDFFKSLYYAANTQIIALVYFGLESLFTEHPHFPTWAEWLPVLRATVFAIVGYLVGKLGVNNVGQIYTKDKSIVHVDAEALDTLKQKAAQADTDTELSLKDIYPNSDKPAS